MTKSEYDEFKQSVEHYLDGLTHVSTGACPGCDECGLSDVGEMDCNEYEVAGESHFSWDRCECCDQPYGGDRHPAHAVSPNTDDIIHLDVCVDCLFYIEYGRLDDQAMLDMEDTES